VKGITYIDNLTKNFKNVYVMLYWNKPNYC